jgi:glycosyltransferase involved in cell wall biosynthesis
MIIAVNAVSPSFKPAASDFFHNAFLLIAAQQPQHQFIFIGFTSAATAASSNCSYLHTGVKIKSPLRFTYWLNYKLPSLLKKNKADIAVGYNCTSLRCKLPQVLFADDASFLNHPEWYTNGWLRFYKKNMPAFLQKAVTVAVASQFLKNNFIEQYKIAEEKITVVYNAPATVYKPFAHWNQKESMKDRLTDGKEYFLYAGILSTQQNLISLLKAFTFFKQRQKSNMMLVLASATNAEAGFIKSLSSYKFKSSVVLAESLPADELAEITAAAYAVVYPVIYDATGAALLQALQCHTAIVAANNTAMPEICSEAAVYCYADDYNDIAAKMMLLFTNEDRRNLLIAKSREQANKFVAQTQAMMLWQLIQNNS